MSKTKPIIKPTKVPLPEPEIDLEGWMSVMDEAMVATSDVVPEGYTTLQNLALKLKANRYRVSEIVKQLVKEGRAKQAPFRIKTNNRYMSVMHYKLLNKTDAVRI